MVEGRHGGGATWWRGDMVDGDDDGDDDGDEGVPVLAGVHHVKLPVTDLERSVEWYRTRLGYQPVMEFVEHDQLMGVAMRHPAGGPDLGLRIDPDRAVAAAGFDYFAIGVPDRHAMDRLAGRLTALGEQHAGVHLATLGWILPMLHDPDGHEVRFYTIESHTDPTHPPDGPPLRIDDPRETAERREAEQASETA
jgi:catechol 2,3-dioxygenase-like lactoylglutathione lyase family enzyme